MEPEIQNPQPPILNPQLPIFLVGFMGCGKSTVGEALAAKLSRSFVDLDKRIEARADATIADLIQREGEEHFRQIEKEALQQVARASAAVIALGGGAVTRPENRELMEITGLTVWLNAPFELCWQRIQQDRTVRPLAPNEEEARARYIERLPLYQQAALHIEVNEAQSADDVATAILQRLGLGNATAPKK